MGAGGGGGGRRESAEAPPLPTPPTLVRRRGERGEPSPPLNAWFRPASLLPSREWREALRPSRRYLSPLPPSSSSSMAAPVPSPSGNGTYMATTVARGFRAAPALPGQAEGNGTSLPRPGREALSAFVPSFPFIPSGPAFSPQPRGVLPCPAGVAERPLVSSDRVRRCDGSLPPEGPASCERPGGARGGGVWGVIGCCDPLFLWFFFPLFCGVFVLVGWVLRPLPFRKMASRCPPRGDGQTNGNRDKGAQAPRPSPRRQLRSRSFIHPPRGCPLPEQSWFPWTAFCSSNPPLPSIPSGRRRYAAGSAFPCPRRRRRR